MQAPSHVSLDRVICLHSIEETEETDRTLAMRPLAKSTQYSTAARGELSGWFRRRQHDRVESVSSPPC
jgi:hypothetical protein